MSATIRISNLIYSPETNTAPLLNIPAWDVNPGERVFLYGPSGSGKTSLLNLICGICQADSGAISVNDTDVCALGARARDRFRMQTIGIIFQQFNLLPWLSVVDNIKLGLCFSGKNDSANFDKVIKQLIDRLKLPRTCLQQQAAKLSVGQQQRVAIARALIKEPPLIIADEPTSALDEETRQEFINTLLDCADESKSTVLFVSHEHSLGKRFDYVVDLRNLNRITDAIQGNSHVS